MGDEHSKNIADRGQGQMNSEWQPCDRWRVLQTQGVGQKVWGWGGLAGPGRKVGAEKKWRRQRRGERKGCWVGGGVRGRVRKRG